MADAQAAHRTAGAERFPWREPAQGPHPGPRVPVDGSGRVDPAGADLLTSWRYLPDDRLRIAIHVFN
jgi:hypothetical protein